MNSLSQRLYNIIYILRRCSFLTISMFYIQKANGFITLIVFAILNQMFQIFIVNTKSFKKRILNRMELFNEIFIQFSIYLMICFTNWIPNLNIQYQYGQYIIFCISFYSVINIIIIVVMTAKKVYLLIFKVFNMMYQYYNSKSIQK